MRGGDKTRPAVNYRSAGTVEFVYDSDAARLLPFEVNTVYSGRARRHRAGVGVDRSLMIDLRPELPPLAELRASR